MIKIVILVQGGTTHKRAEKEIEIFVKILQTSPTHHEQIKKKTVILFVTNTYRTHKEKKVGAVKKK